MVLPQGSAESVSRSRSKAEFRCSVALSFLEINIFVCTFVGFLIISQKCMKGCGYNLCSNFSRCVCTCDSEQVYAMIINIDMTMINNQ